MKELIMQTITNDISLGWIVYAVAVRGANYDLACYYCFIEDYSEIDDSLAVDTARSGNKLSEEEAVHLGFKIPEGFHYRT